MGAIVSCLACQAASCVGSMCCSACGQCAPSLGGRIVYSFFFFMTAIIAWALKTFGTAHRLRWIPTLRDECDGSDYCFETQTVYRITAVVAFFHLIMALLMIGIKRKGDVRHTFQDGWWGIKLILMAGAVVGFFFIPNVAFHYYSWVALVAAGLFIVVQLVYLIDFAHSWAENWIEKMEEDLDSKMWLYILFIATGILDVLVVAGTVLGYVFFHSPLSTAFITITLLLNILIHFISIHPKVQEASPKSGLLQPAFISLYCTYIIWSANLNYDNPFKSATSNGPISSNLTLFIGALFTVIAVLYATLSTASNLGGSSGEREPLTAAEGDEESQKEKADPEEPLDYNYSVFHLVFALGAMYIAMLMTDWSTVSNPADHTTAPFWVKGASSLVCIALYIWTVIAPAVFPDREWN
eukprot:TRINITY_DN12716_c0_g1_i1.p1 TRINITY_DN12716_c0_g1~~TRINITY_DN12716_c0_g1_i1.p1  ORF type:complete len:411 (-),score=122.89 TRINITY_DN12716_c0_g1_i1:93-1325(-)